MMMSCRTRLEAVRKQHAALKQQLEGQFDHLDSLEAKVWGGAARLLVPPQIGVSTVTRGTAQGHLIHSLVFLE